MPAVTRFLRYVFFLLIVRPVVLVVLGLNVRHRERLPADGPAIIAGTHNSHLDTLALITLFPMRLLRRLRTVAAADYFLRNRLIAWFALRIIGVIPLDRTGGTPRERLFDGVSEALGRGEIVILFPEGSRGEPERLAEFKSGISHLAAAHPDVPVVPVFLHGLGKALPRGESLLVPFYCDVFVGPSLRFAETGDRKRFMDRLAGEVRTLAAEGDFPPWE